MHRPLSVTHPPINCMKAIPSPSLAFLLNQKVQMATRSPTNTAASMMAAQLLAMKKKDSLSSQYHHQSTLSSSSFTDATTIPTTSAAAPSRGRGRRRHQPPLSRTTTAQQPATPNDGSSSSATVGGGAMTSSDSSYTIMEPFEGIALALDPPGTRIPGEKAILNQLERQLELYGRRHTKWRIAVKQHRRQIDLLERKKQKRYEERVVAQKQQRSSSSADSSGSVIDNRAPEASLMDASQLFDLMDDDVEVDEVPSNPSKPTKLSSEGEAGAGAADEGHRVDDDDPSPPPPEEPQPPQLPTKVTYHCRGCGTGLFRGTVDVNLRPARGMPFVTIKESNTSSSSYSGNDDSESTPKKKKAASTTSAAASRAVDIQDRLSTFMDTLETMTIPYPQFHCSIGDKAVYLGSQSVDVEYATMDDIAQEEQDEEVLGGGVGGGSLPLHTLKRFDISKRIKSQDDALERLSKRAKMMPFMPVAELKRDYKNPYLSTAETQRNKRLFKAAARQDQHLASTARDQRYPGMCACCNRVVCVVASTLKGGYVVNPTSVECRLD